ncbi:MAG TPA: hypothetical protein VHT24_17275 [Pseudacidobacterium sp.]|nr:hypothetical protein [Pseudacidobacterium sp.]
MSFFSFMLQAQDADKTRAEIAVLESMLPKVPDRAVVLYFLAEDYAQVGYQPKAFALLKESMAAGESINPEDDTALRALHSNSEFRALIANAEQQYPAVHNAREAFIVPEKDLIPEGLAYDADTKVFYLSSLFRRKIVKINGDERSSDFVPAGKENLLPICGLRVDIEDHSLWAAGCQDSGHGELYHFNANGKLLEHFPPSAPGKHLFNDLVLNGASEIYLTDSLANQTYRFDRKTHTFTALAFPRKLYYPNGITQSDDQSVLFVADAFGVLRYDLKTQTAQEINPGPSKTLAGFDGLYWYHGDLVGVQNGIGLPRIVQVALSPDGLHAKDLKILEYRSPFVSLPTTGAIKGSQFYFIENSQIDNDKNDKIADPAKLEPVRIGVVNLAPVQ